MPKFKIKFVGFAYVEADDKEEAEVAFDDGEAYLEEKEITSIRRIKDYDKTITDF